MRGGAAAFPAHDHHGLIGSGHIGSSIARLAVDAGDVVVVTIPLKAYRDVPVEPLAGKVVNDTNNYYPERDGHVAELDPETTTTAEPLQAHLPTSGVVKAFSNIYFEHLLNTIGYDAHDAGPLAEGWRFQRDTAADTQVYSGATFEEARPADAERVATLLWQSKRYTDMD